MNKRKNVRTGQGSVAPAPEALRPLVSLLEKSAKAQRKLAPGTWQHAMLRDNLRALRTALALLDGKSGAAKRFARDDLRQALRALDSMAEKTRRTRTKFPPGSSPHTLQRNRLAALRLAKARVKAALDQG